MVRVLIVDDEYAKAQLISLFLQHLDPNVEIEHSTTSIDARIKLMNNNYDLMLLDINLPANMGAQPNSLGGMDLFDMILLDNRSNTPVDIVFITEKEDSIEQYRQEANKRGISICKFSNYSIDWKIFIEGRFKLASNKSKKLKNINPKVDIAIITALGTPELDAVLKLPYNWQSKRFSDDPTGYSFGSKNTSSRAFSLVAASPRRKGMPASASLAMKMIERFKPKIIVMLGICAGVEAKVNIGDIIVGDPLWDWGSGKLAQDRYGSKVFQASPHQVSIEHRISQLAMEIGNLPSFATQILQGWTGNFPQGRVNVHVGPLASGAQVIAADNALCDILKQNRDLLGIDMEAYAVMTASDHSRNPSPIGLVVKSVCDYADSDKHDCWQEYAAYTSAAFFDLLISDDFFPI
ncbi:Nucleoside phosphorylase [Pantoea ananatis]|uniref:phosphorylase family protein n=1 Tax=Pantoea ananas TaxID=553 RepID=UPI00099C6F7A|nr:response regulator [Pantoea ananatis]SKA77858.1 Nucleoside phosphorylase [Pantoea ananatis]